MIPQRYCLAQINVARLAFPLDDPRLADFVAQLEPVNAVADAAPGFIWRLKTDAGDATGIQAFPDRMILVNMSVWESVESLRAFTYRGDHLRVFRDRARWFEKLENPSHALWWLAAGAVPSLEEGRRRLEHLWKHGPTEEAFTFARVFAAPGAIVSPA